MDIRSALKEREIKSFRRMSRGKRLEYAIELSDFVQNLSRSVKAHGKRIQGDSKRIKRS